MAWFSLEISALTGKLGMFWYIPSHLVHFVDTLPSGDDGARVIVHNQMVSEGHKLLSAPPSCTTGLDTGDQVLEMARGKIDMSFRAASHWFGASALVNGSARCMEVFM